MTEQLMESRMTKEKLIVVGNGMAPGRMLEHVIEADPDRYDIQIFNAEPRVNYNRLMLSPVLSGEKSYSDIITHNDDWYETNGIQLHKAMPVMAIDSQAQTITTNTGDTHHYDKLVIATGSNPFVIPVPGKDLPGVLVYRDLDDVDKMIEVAKGHGNAVVIGGGLLGLEAAAGLQAQGMRVTVIHLADTLMEKQLDAAAGYLLQKAMADKGIEIVTGANTEAIEGEGCVEAVRLADGRRLPCELVVMAVGIKPSISLALDAGLAINRGILVDDTLCTSVNNIYALGECAEHRDICYGLVAPLYEMAKTLADQLLEKPSSYQGSQVSTKLKVSGVDLFSAGDFEDTASREEIILRDASAGIYKRIVLEDNKLCGIVMYGDTTDSAWFFDLLKKQEDISDFRDRLIFGQAYQGGDTVDPTAAVAALSDDAEICGCNGVCKGKIVESIETLKLTTLDEVRAHTKASSSCGTCTGLVEQLMVLSIGDQYQAASVVPMCACTDLGHDDVRRLIRSKSLLTIPELMQALEWKSSCGCIKCRPALNYYLVCEWPEEYEDDYQSRFINERVHANIQKDGTYSVVPRMWGGMTSSSELRAIADVVDKFDIPAVKVTGGQRIDMLGVKKEQLPAVWSDLGKAGFVSGHAYAKGLRTVKTCVGKTWCRFGTQDSTELGIRLERSLWGSWTPAKVKLAVSGCPRNCAEATCKDIGIICVDSGFGIQFAGAAGLDIKPTEVLGHVDTEDEVMQYVSALLQMYREQGHYLERMYKWARRVGVDVIREQIMNDADKRVEYQSRFEASQRVAQVDPWAERTQGVHHHEFVPLVTNDTQVVA